MGKANRRWRGTALPLIAKFSQRTDYHGPEFNGTRCWVWVGPRTNKGYGLFMPGGKCYAHRWSYEFWVGSIPEGLTIDHLCRNRACVNPGHMEPVTIQENIQRAVDSRPNLVSPAVYGRRRSGFRYYRSGPS